jgi:hypothetical protein
MDEHLETYLTAHRFISHFMLSGLAALREKQRDRLAIDVHAKTRRRKEEAWFCQLSRSQAKSL